MDRSASSRLWLTAAEVADLFGVTARTVARWIDDGSLPGYRQPGKRGSRRVLKVKLIHFVQQRPEFHFVLEILNGQPISTGARTGPSQGREAEQGGEDRSEEAGWEASPDREPAADYE